MITGPEDSPRSADGERPESLDGYPVAEGTVKWWREEKGYGAIASPATAPWDIWCHFAAVQMEGFRALTPGERVMVEYIRVDQGSFRYRAHAVRRLSPPPVDAAAPAHGTG